MDTNDTSVVDPTRRCCLCHRTIPSEIDTRGSLEPMGICNNCNFLFFGDNVTTQTWYNNGIESVESMLAQEFPDLQPAISEHVYETDSDASVDVDTYLNNDDIDDIDNSHDENPGESVVGRIQLHRSLATNGRNRPRDWLSEILSDESIRNSERRRLFGILEDYVDVETHGSTRLAAPAAAAAWFVKSLEQVVVDEPGSVCVICKDNLCIGVVNRLPCGHVYHGSCIVPWLSARNTCPLCRYELPTDDRDRSSEVQVEGVVAESGGRRWWFVVAPLVSVVGIVLWWLGGGVFGGQRDDRSTRWWSLFCIE
ncbi:uncharacterized protein LOC143546252 [Bidens hawaiensis]|uniref:uncharacterized protein LOC143546252 n=1 Tax=Bidens hawaiensis TaxID=980011 RepID=UPI004049476A